MFKSWMVDNGHSVNYTLHCYLFLQASLFFFFFSQPSYLSIRLTDYLSLTTCALLGHVYLHSFPVNHFASPTITIYLLLIRLFQLLKNPLPSPWWPDSERSLIKLNGLMAWPDAIWTSLFFIISNQLFPVSISCEY